MSSAKQYNLPPHLIIDNESGASNVTSLVTEIFNKDNVGIQIEWTGTLSGMFDAQISLNYNPRDGSGTWTSLPLSPPIVASGSPDDGYMELNQLSAKWIRLVYTASSGAGNITAIITAKGI